MTLRFYFNKLRIIFFIVTGEWATNTTCSLPFFVFLSVQYTPSRKIFKYFKFICSWNIFSVLSRLKTRLIFIKRKVMLSPPRLIRAIVGGRGLEHYMFGTPFVFSRPSITQGSKINSRFSSSLSSVKNFTDSVLARGLAVGGRGLEPPCLAALPPKGSASAISPPARIDITPI